MLGVSSQKTIASSDGVAAIVDRLSCAADAAAGNDDVAEMLTAVLWNLSSCSVTLCDRTQVSYILHKTSLCFLCSASCVRCKRDTARMCC